MLRAVYLRGKESKMAQQNTYEVHYKIGSSTGYGTVKASDSAEAERIMKKKYSSRDIVITNVKKK